MLARLRVARTSLQKSSRCVGEIVMSAYGRLRLFWVGRVWETARGRSRPRADSGRSPAKGSSLAPIFRNQRGRLCPRRLYQSVLEPLLTKIGVLSDDQLEAGDVFLGELQ
jgi:hypothetical protein